MATYWIGSACTADYGDTSSLRIQPGYGSLNRAIRQAVIAQYDDSDCPVSVDEDDVVVHCGYLECHHDIAWHEFDVKD